MKYYEFPQTIIITRKEDLKDFLDREDIIINSIDTINGVGENGEITIVTYRKI